MMEHSRDSFIKEMNNLGQKRIPFLFIIDYEFNTPIILRLEEAANDEVFYSIKGLGNFDTSCKGDQPLQFDKKPINYSTYLVAFGNVMNEILRGNTFLLNLFD